MSEARAHELFVKMHQSVDGVSHEVKIFRNASGFPNSRPRIRKTPVVHKGCRMDDDNEGNAWWVFTNQKTHSTNTSHVAHHD